MRTGSRVASSRTCDVRTREARPDEPMFGRVFIVSLPDLPLACGADENGGVGAGRRAERERASPGHPAPESTMTQSSLADKMSVEDMAVPTPSRSRPGSGPDRGRCGRSERAASEVHVEAPGSRSQRSEESAGWAACALVLPHVTMRVCGASRTGRLGRTPYSENGPSRPPFTYSEVAERRADACVLGHGLTVPRP